MSGTSLDGLDIAFVHFTHKNNAWTFEITKAETVAYPSEISDKLRNIYFGTALELADFHNTYGKWIGYQVNQFIQDFDTPHFIASHGHTIFHRPELGFSLQIGSGAHIYAQTGITTVCDFRSVDVALNGQGAPLVPKGDQELFKDFDYLVNIGGIANITHNKSSRAFDITIANMALNELANERNLDYDPNGDLAKSGKVNEILLEQLNNLPFKRGVFGKSLGREFYEKEFKPIIDSFNISLEDKLHTVCRHIAFMFRKAVRVFSETENKKMLISGGGVLNNFLVECIRKELPELQIVIPERKIIEFKEALIFAFLGLLRLRNENNCLKTVTGATSDALGGAIYGPSSVI